jgi:hypothetical protein
LSLTAGDALGIDLVVERVAAHMLDAMKDAAHDRPASSHALRYAEPKHSHRARARIQIETKVGVPAV